MVKIRQVLIAPEAREYLIKRQLDKQYEKAKIFITAGHFANVNLKIREPKEDRIWYFRINKQFRALCELDGEILYVLAIDNHQ
jgi:hypothetical protein